MLVVFYIPISKLSVQSIVNGQPLTRPSHAPILQMLYIILIYLCTTLILNYISQLMLLLFIFRVSKIIASFMK